MNWGIFWEAMVKYLEASINEVEFDSKKTLLAASQTTVCGAQTITTLMLVCKNLDCNHGKLLKYYTSTDVRGDYGYCVGYFSGILTK